MPVTVGHAKNCTVADMTGTVTMISGAPVVSGALVEQLIIVGVPGVSYLLTCLVERGSEKPRLQALIVVTK